MKDTPAGPMPADWQLRRLGEFSREVNVRAGEANDLPLLSVTKHHGIVRAADYFGEGLVVRDTATYKVVSRGQFAYATIHLDEGSIGRLSNEDAGTVSPMYTVFEVGEELVPGFLLELLKSTLYLQRYQALIQGSVNRRASLPFKSLRTMAIHYPPPAEQRAITQILTAVDNTIRKTETYLDQLRATKHQVIRELLTKGHPDFQTKMARLKEVWRIGRVAPIVKRIPKHWELVMLTDVTRLESGHTPSRKHPEYWGGGTAWLSLGDTSEMKKLQVMTTAESVTQAGLDNSSARLLPADTVVLSRTAVRGLCSRLGRPMATSQDFVAFVCGERVLPTYLVQLFRHMKREWRRLEQGTSPTNKTLYFSVFKRLKIALPPPEEQAAIAEVGESFDQRLVDETAALDQLREVKRGLAQALLTGRIRVPVDGSNSDAEGGP